MFGHDVVRGADPVRGTVSLTGQYASVDEDLTGMENLTLLGRLLGHRKPAARDRAAQLLAAFGLTDAADRQVWEIVRAVVAHGTTVLRTTQYLDEADRPAEPAGDEMEAA